MKRASCTWELVVAAVVIAVVAALFIVVTVFVAALTVLAILPVSTTGATTVGVVIVAVVGAAIVALDVGTVVSAIVVLVPAVVVVEAVVVLELLELDEEEEVLPPPPLSPPPPLDLVSAAAAVVVLEEAAGADSAFLAGAAEALSSLLISAGVKALGASTLPTETVVICPAPTSIACGAGAAGAGVGAAAGAGALPPLGAGAGASPPLPFGSGLGAGAEEAVSLLASALPPPAALGPVLEGCPPSGALISIGFRVTAILPKVQAIVSGCLGSAGTIPRNLVPLIPIVAVLVSSLNLSGFTLPIFPVIALKAPSLTPNLAFDLLAPAAAPSSYKNSCTLKFVFAPMEIAVPSENRSCADEDAFERIESLSSMADPAPALITLPDLWIDMSPLETVILPIEARRSDWRINKRSNMCFMRLS